MRQWEIRDTPQWVLVATNSGRYDQNLAEIAEILLKWFSQLTPVTVTSIRPESTVLNERKDRL